MSEHERLIQGETDARDRAVEEARETEAEESTDPAGGNEEEDTDGG